MRVHLEGMGVNGSLLARKLAAAKVDFTWNDTDAPVTAWKASTGAIYPSGSTKFGPDQACWNVWSRWYRDNFLPADVLEPANYWFGHKKPPHEGRYDIVCRSEENLGMAMPPSFHINAQALVLQTRALFADRRASVAAPAEHHIVTHGFGQRMISTYWGWTRLVELRYDQYPYGAMGQRPSFYFRPNKLVMAYAYPCPGTPYWYAGSSIIYQKVAKPLDIPPKYAKWKENFLRLSNGAVEVVGEGPMLEGWRPKSQDDRWVVKRGNVITLRPLWNSGIRHFPYQWYQVSKLLGIRDHTYEDLAT